MSAIRHIVLMVVAILATTTLYAQQPKGADIEFAESIERILHAGSAVVAGMVVGKQNRINFKRCGKDGTFRITAVIGTALVNGGILTGHGTFPLQYFHISRVKKRFYLSGDLIDTFDQIAAIFFSGTEIPGDDH